MPAIRDHQRFQSGGLSDGQYIEALEEFVPIISQFCTRLVGSAPRAVQQCGTARHRGAVAHVVVAQRRGDLLLPGKILVAHAGCRRRAQ
jgi:hypothetical protein